METVLRKYDFYKSKYAVNMLERYREQERVLQEYFGEPVKRQFENLLVKIPEKRHELQTALHGDYMQLPPANERVAHNVAILKCRDL